MSKLTKEPSDEVADIARRVEEREQRAPNVSVEMVDGTANMTIGKSSDNEEILRLMDALGVCDTDLFSPLLGQIGNAVSKNSEVTNDPLQFVIAFIKSIEPENEIETLLAAQMAVTHICAMDASRRYHWGSTLAQKDSAERAMTKLTRTFTTQMEALKKNRAKAQQVVRVERVNVESGGQAIVGDVTTGGEG